MPDAHKDRDRDILMSRLVSLSLHVLALVTSRDRKKEKQNTFNCTGLPFELISQSHNRSCFPAEMVPNSIAFIGLRPYYYLRTHFGEHSMSASRRQSLGDADSSHLDTSRMHGLGAPI